LGDISEKGGKFLNAEKQKPHIGDKFGNRVNVRKAQKPGDSVREVRFFSIYAENIDLDRNRPFAQSVTS
jgi:hypothetical protein